MVNWFYLRQEQIQWGEVWSSFSRVFFSLNEKREAFLLLIPFYPGTNMLTGYSPWKSLISCAIRTVQDLEVAGLWVSPCQQGKHTQSRSRFTLCFLTHDPRDCIDRAKGIIHACNIYFRHLQHLALKSRAPADPFLLAVMLEMTYAHTAKFWTRQPPKQNADVCN